MDSTDDNPPCNEIIGKLLFQRLLKQPLMVMADLAWFRKYLGKHEAQFDVPEPGKSDARSAGLRREGNELYREQKWREALAKYNEGICYAEAGSAELGFGFADRSAVYYKMGEYEYALANIALARRNHYPEKLADKLREREVNCHAKIDGGQSKGTVPCPRMAINVETNPKIPFLANQIRMKVSKDAGRGLYAKRDFKPGDVLLDEKALMTVIDSKLRYLNCSWCSDENLHSLVPCPDCVSYMYCSEECLRRDRETCHRFECGVAETVREFSYCCTMFGPKMFFYGLSLFKDDIQQMMEFCQSNAQTGGKPLSIDFSKDDRLQEFKEFVKMVPTGPTKHGFAYRFCAAMHDVIFGKHPLIKSIITTKAQKLFMLNFFHDYSQLAISHAYTSDPIAGPIVNVFCSLASLLKHSCDPNTVIVLDAGRVKITVLRPIRSGDKIFISNGPLFWDAPEDIDPLDFPCTCVVCNPATNLQWRAQGRKLPSQAVLHWRVLEKVMKSDANDAAKLNALQQYVLRYAYLHPNPDWAAALKVYYGMLRCMVKQENEALARAAALKMAER